MGFSAPTRATVLVALALATAAPATAQAPAARAAAVDSIFARWDRPDSPGGAVVVVRDGEIVHRSGYGMADLEHGVPITPETVFDIASVSKQFTAFAVALLAREGTLSLDDPVRRWIPELPAYTGDVTLRHLIHHTGGVRDWVELLYLAGWRFDDVINGPDILELARRQRALNFAPGTDHRYSNTGYNLLAEVVARASGRSFREFMRTRIFEPLGMASTHVHDDHREVDPGRARSYAPMDDGGMELLVNNTTAVGSSSIFTTAPDLGRWVRNLMQGTLGGPELRRRMRHRGVLASGDTIAYAFGLVHGTHRGLRTLGHGGSWRGYRSRLLLYPEQGLGIAVVGNVTAFDPGDKARRVAAVYLGDHMEPPPTRPEGERGGGSGPETAPLSAARLEAYTGRYFSSELGTEWRLAAADGHLVATQWTHGPLLLHHVEEDEFTTPGIRGRQTYRFVRDSAGRVTGFVVDGRRFNGVRFHRFPEGTGARSSAEAVPTPAADPHGGRGEARTQGVRGDRRPGHGLPCTPTQATIGTEEPSCRS